MTKYEPITNIDVTIKEIYDEYTRTSIEVLWESRFDDCQDIESLTHEFRKDISGLLSSYLRRQTLRRMFSDGQTMMMIPSAKFDLIDNALSAKRDFTITIYDGNSKLISVLTTDEVSW